ncbi:BMP family ABC transporter substrate-binding protein, partial [bacterium LRH843]|nr:BMP family ABC transporter substrate-binding protein [bacterium LRH843]
IIAGEFHPFTGPIKDQSGTVRIPEGETATNEQLATMDWYVEGMTATLPN